MARRPTRRRRARRHYIVEWAEALGRRQVDIVNALDVDKGTVSRWFTGNLPQEDHQIALAEYFEIEPEALLRHPDIEWISQFFDGRSEEERERIKNAMEIGWPKQ